MRTLAVSVSVLVGMCSVQAQTARLTTVDKSGHVVPIAANTTNAETVASVGPSGCPNTQTLTPDDAQALIRRIATEEGFSAEFALSVAKVESHFNVGARSDKGAYGLMQLMPETARRFKVALCDPADNVRGGVRFLQALSAKYQNSLYVLAAYNAGEDAVERNRGVPPYPETVRFVAQVIDNLNGWPMPGTASPRRTRNASALVADMIEPPRASSSSETTVATPRNTASWSDGFVMHVE